MSEQVASKQIYYKKFDEMAPRYKYVRVPLSNLNSTTVTVAATATSAIAFKLPYNQTYNLSKSRIRFDVPIAAQTAFSNTAADSFSWCDSISLETGNGLQLVNATNCNRYCHIATKLLTKQAEFLTRDITDGTFPQLTTLNPMGTVAIATASPAGVFVAQTNEPQYLIQSVTGTALTVQVNHALGDIKHTLFALDKDLYFGNNDMYIRANIDYVDHWCYHTTTLALGTPVTLTTPMTSLTNCYLYLAIEQNPMLVDKLVTQFNTSELKVLTDYTVTNRVLTGAGTTQTLAVNLTPSMGKTLRRIYQMVFSGSATVGNPYFDCSNIAGSKITNYNTWLDSTKLVDNVIDCAAEALAPSGTKLDSWIYNSPFCKDSVIASNYMYLKNWFHCDSFENAKPNNVEGIPVENTSDGVVMRNPILYQYNAVSPSLALNLINVAVFTRNVRISLKGVDFE